MITGRGSGETGGVIRRELPLWLNLPALRPLVLAAAHPHAANPGVGAVAAAPSAAGEVMRARGGNRGYCEAMPERHRL